MRGAARGDDGFDVAIVDMMMPGMDGREVAAEIRADEVLRDLVVVLLTSAGQSEVPVPGIDAELVKPVRPSQLFDVLHTLIAERSARPARRPPEIAVGPPDPSREWAEGRFVL